ncbi:hypothetical protein DTO021C3_722 [Paecilomyces variotii]|nr:hypothetical protein DTO169C6_3159 [Paecilomyces variotii]KAJ9291821.1 hypothetical protein DTO021C3_722 [Paecilomyces variotii]KAJ9399618.1 hypothetical protein DTO282F9_3492 [Paecilomyces variotii]
MDETLLLPTARKRRRSSFWPFERDDSGRLEDSKGWIDLDLLSPQSEGQSRSSSTEHVHEATSPISPDASTDKPSPRLIHLINAGRGFQPTHERAWVKGVLVCACVTSVVLFVNIILTIVATAIAYSRDEQQQSSASVLYQGECSRTKGWASGIHLVINVLSTLVLGASNYCMQCLGSPSREDVDRAHAQRTWLDIGTPSIGNFNFVGRRRFVLWFVLLMTLLPIHLIYNSAVFPTVGTNEYAVVAVSSDFDFNNPGNHTKDYINCFEPSIAATMDAFYSNMSQGRFERLTKQECIDTFAVDYPSGRGTLVVVTNDQSTIGNQSLRWVGTGNAIGDMFTATESYLWMCSSLRDSWGRCNKDSVQASFDNWSVAIENWTYPLLQATVDGPYGPVKLSSTSMDPDLCEYGQDDALCLDIHNLENILWQYPSSEAGLRQDLDNGTAWRNATWARRANVSQTGTICASQIGTGSYNTAPVDHCLSQTTEQDCQLLFSLPICIAVILCNLTKIVCMFLTARDDRKEIFLTVGDAISSFLTRPDPTTEGRCLLSMKNISKGPWPWKSPLSPNKQTTTVKYSPPSRIPDVLPPRTRWIQAVSIWRWVVTITLCVFLLSVTGFLLSDGIASITSYGSSAALPALWQLGFGTATPTTLITAFSATGGSSSFIGMILLANVPQLLVSTAYFLYNGLLTNMLLAAEYDDYAMSRKPLRVSWPKGQQRSTYYLSLPYRYGIPLLIVSAMLHWLVSESIFYVEILQFNMYGKLMSNDRIVTCGFSPIAIIFAIGLGCLMVFAVLGLGLRWYQSNMPLVHGCSAAISAACHPLTDDNEHALKPIMWGEIPIRKEDNKALIGERLSSPDRVACPTSSLPSRNKDYEIIRTRELVADAADDDDASENSPSPWHYTAKLDEGQYGHCSFTSGDVIAPSPVRLYV